MKRNRTWIVTYRDIYTGQKFTQEFQMPKEPPPDLTLSEVRYALSDYFMDEILDVIEKRPHEIVRH